jgi:hypothetical protein
VARRINYGFEKRQKEAKRKKKQADKLEKRRLSKLANAVDAPPPVLESPATANEDPAPPDATTPATVEKLKS